VPVAAAAASAGKTLVSDAGVEDRQRVNGNVCRECNEHVPVAATTAPPADLDVRQPTRTISSKLR
jgi:hypothetical protein